MNEYHLLDFSRYIFMLSIIWGYLNFSQFMLIWYGNIPEETIYYANRWNHGWLIFFSGNFLINWFIPFLVLMPQKLDKNIHIVYGMCILLLVGLYTEIFEQVMPDVTTYPKFGITEIGVFAGIAGVFLYTGAKALAKAPLIPANHPYLEESIQHHIH